MAELLTPAPFAYQAQSTAGNVFAGTIDAVNADDASLQLQSLGLRVISLTAGEKKRPAAGAAFKSADFLAFNQQLAALTSGGLPVERSLKLMAGEISDKKHAAALNRIANELEKGSPLATAFATEKAGFPPLYATLIDAGVRSNNLPAMLLNLGRHVQMLQRLRAAWWKSASYPLMVLISLLLVMAFIWIWVMPQFIPLSAGPVFRDSNSKYGAGIPTGRTAIDPSVQWTLAVANVVGYGVMSMIALFLLSVLSLWVLSRRDNGRGLMEKIVLPLPVIGPILRWNLIARWCDALHMGVRGGMPLPAALELARDAVPSPKLAAETNSLIGVVNSGRSLELDSPTRFIPPLIPASLQMGIEKNDLPAAAAMLTQMYEEQTEIRLAVLPRILSPLLLILTASCIGLAVAAMLMPLVAMLQSLTKPW